MNPTERLAQIKDQIDGAKTRQAEIKGKISSVREQMQTGFKVKALPTAEKKLESMGIDLDKMEVQFNEGMEDLEREMEKARKEKLRRKRQEPQPKQKEDDSKVKVDKKFY